MKNLCRKCFKNFISDRLETVCDDCKKDLWFGTEEGRIK